VRQPWDVSEAGLTRAGSNPPGFASATARRGKCRAPAEGSARERKDLAESEGFEPSVPVTQYGSLANCWFQPLTHDSERQEAGYSQQGLPLQPQRPMPL
jgi:hypothetical protein